MAIAGDLCSRARADVFTITESWLMENRTGRVAGWTYAQCRALGIMQHGNKGWKKKVVGTVLSNEQKQAFERLGREYRDVAKR
jgi:hypothetical protein